MPAGTLDSACRATGRTGVGGEPHRVLSQRREGLGRQSPALSELRSLGFPVLKSGSGPREHLSSRWEQDSRL